MIKPQRLSIMLFCSLFALSMGSAPTSATDKPVFMGLTIRNQIEHEVAAERLSDSTIDIFINGNYYATRILGYTGGGPISKFVKPGLNVVEIDNPADIPIEIQIIEFPYFGAQGAQGRLIASKAWTESLRDSSNTFTFELESRRLLPPFVEDANLPEKEVVERELTVLVQHLHELCVQRDHKQFLDIVLAGEMKRNPTKHREALRHLGQALEYFDVLPLDGDLEFIHGSNFVFVYSQDVIQHRNHQRILFRPVSENAISISGLHFSYIDGRWIVW